MSEIGWDRNAEGLPSVSFPATNLRVATYDELMAGTNFGPGARWLKAAAAGFALPPRPKPRLLDYLVGLLVLVYSGRRL